MLLSGIIAIFISICLLVVSLYMLIGSHRLQVLRRLESLSQLYNIGEPLDEDKTPSTDDVNKIEKKTLNRGMFYKFANSTEIQLTKADIPLKFQEFAISIAIISLLSGLLFYAISHKIMIAILAVVIAIIASKLFINIKKMKRITKINQQLSDVITLISNGLKAGHSFFQAIGIVAREMRPPISIEFKKMIRQINLGMPTDEALINLGKSVESKDLDLVITAILIQRQVGGNLAEVLDKIAYTIKERVRLKREITAKTAQGKISAFILMLLAPVTGFIIYLMNPGFLSVLFTDSLGLLILAIAILLQIIGIFSMVKIINIDV